MTNDKPKLRPVDAFPAEYEGRALIALRDPQGYAEDMVLVPREVLAILGYFDGQHTILDIQQEYMKQFGELLYSDLVAQLVEQLDAHHLLDSPAFERFKLEAERQFRSSSVRLAFHAGAAYEEEPEALRRQLRALFDPPEGPGQPDPKLVNGPLMGLVAPHIDLHRGGAGYAHAYKALAEAEPADLYVIFGVAHAGSEHPVILTDKDFQTPLGRVETDRELVAELRAGMPEDLFSDEISHKTEHSIEFQTIFLQHLFGGRHPFKIVPILAGSFHEMLCQEPDCPHTGEVERFVEALSKALRARREAGQRICLIAGVDLSHMGQRFGDLEELTPEFLERVQREDRVFLDHVLNRDPEALFDMIRTEQDWRKVCGFPALYLFLKVLPESRGTLLNYRQWADPPEGCSVSFASLAFR